MDPRSCLSAVKKIKCLSPAVQPAPRQCIFSAIPAPSIQLNKLINLCIILHDIRQNIVEVNSTESHLPHHWSHNIGLITTHPNLESRMKDNRTVHRLLQWLQPFKTKSLHIMCPSMLQRNSQIWSFGWLTPVGVPGPRNTPMPISGVRRRNSITNFTELLIALGTVRGLKTMYRFLPLRGWYWSTEHPTPDTLPTRQRTPADRCKHVPVLWRRMGEWKYSSTRSQLLY
jgi:hypothetical protein